MSAERAGLRAELDGLLVELEELRQAQSKSKQEGPPPAAPPRPDLEPGQVLAEDPPLKLVYEPRFTAAVGRGVHRGKLNLRDDKPYVVYDAAGRAIAVCDTEQNGRWWLSRSAQRSRPR